MELRNELLTIINNKTKPVGSLGMLEEIALQIGLIQQRINPSIIEPHVLVFAADHGIAATGLVNPYPQEVTAQMVLNFINGGAAINVFCRQNDIRLKVIDAGVKSDFSRLYNEHFLNAKVAPGTKNYTITEAIEQNHIAMVIGKGKDIVHKIVSGTKCNCIGIGEIGIGNTSSASLIMSATLSIPIEECVGRGTGADDQQMQVKIETLKQAFVLHELQSYSTSPLKLLSKVGGYEIAQMVGAYLQAFEEKMIIVVDGFIATVALLIAYQINSKILLNCIFAHTSSEKGHNAVLNYLKAKPVLNLGLRLGEGTGAALAIPLIKSAVNFLNEMASFESACVTKTMK